MRGAFALLDIIPGVKALSSSMKAARTATRTLGQADNAIMVMGKYSLQRVKSGISQMGKIATNTKSFVKLFVSNVDEGIRLLATKAKTLATKAVSTAKSTIDNVVSSVDDMITKGNRILQGDFSDITNYFKNILPGDTVLVQLSNGDVISMPRSAFDAGDGGNILRSGTTDDIVTINGKTVVVDNTSFDPSFVDPDTGKTNLELMEEGKAPFGYDGRKVNIHHIDQTDTGAVMEITATEHQNNYSELHVNTGQSPSQINRSQFKKWREEYWKWRAENIKFSQ